MELNNPFPVTSRKLLAAIGSGPGATRWTEFFHKYTPGLRDYATRHFRSLEADDLIQDTFLVLVKRLKTYQYDPKAKGAFHNYLTGILRFIAIDQLRSEDRESTGRKRLTDDPTAQHIAEAPFSLDVWKKSAYEVALRRLLADPRVQPQTKEIFKRVAIRGEKPETVAANFGLTRNAVDQIKDRTIRRLKALVTELEKKPR